MFQRQNGSSCRVIPNEPSLEFEEAFRMSSLTQQNGPIHSALADDPDLYEIVKMFVDEMPSRVDQLISEFKSKNWNGLQQTAHQLKGAAGSYGFAEVTPIAGRLEQNLKQNSPEAEIQRSLMDLIAICRRMSIEESDSR